ncbi:hypothetical protein BaRGS_00026294, partial [Batillaria attramentaria]
MTSVPHSHIPYGESGSGHYGNWLARQEAANIAAVKDQIMKAVGGTSRYLKDGQAVGKRVRKKNFETDFYETILKEANEFERTRANNQIWFVAESIPVRQPGDVFTIGDYGTADGSASIPLIREIIELVRGTKGNVQIQVVYEDQPSNDFNSLFKRLQGLIPDPPTYLHEFKDVFVLASGTSFYHQIVPDNSADLLMSFMAAHWMSEAAVIEESITFFMPSAERKRFEIIESEIWMEECPTKFQDSFHRFPNANEAERKLVAAQGAKDWEAFLLLRAKELKSGGVLIVSTPSEDPEMKQQGVRHCNQGFEEGMLNMWRRMRDEGKITNEEFVNTNFNRCTRYLEEYKSSVCGQGVDDRKTWAKAVAQQNRCWSNSSFIRGLSKHPHGERERGSNDEMYSRLEAEVAMQDPK